MNAALRKATRVAAVVVLVATAIGSCALWSAWRSARQELSESRCDGHETFVRSQWMDTTLALGRQAIRGCMVDDLLDRYQLRGMTRAQVVALIGASEQTDLFPGYDMVYWLGPQRGLIGTDSEYLVMKLDKANRVVSVELLTG